MKINIDLPDSELWARFKDEVTRQGKTLREVVPTVFEPALRWFLRETPITEGVPIPPQLPPNQVAYTIPPNHPNPPLTEIPSVKRCDLCDMPTERTFNHKGRKVCYTCWRDGIINDATNKTSLPEAPTSSA